MMTKAKAIRLAASSILVGAALAGGTAFADRPQPAAAGTIAGAVAEAEAAVAAAPRDAANRALLGQAYLEAGRFASAETSFADALSLDPAQPRAALSLTLARIAQGDQHGALDTLAAYESLISPTDRGLAYALAGDPAAAIDLLEWAVRSGEADAKTRQNLALSYALAGRWVEAKLMASYDLAPDQVTQRIMDWSRFAQPRAPSDQVAWLLGVTPSEDPGQPVRLALNAAPAAEPVMQAEAAPAPLPEPAITVAAAFAEAAEIAPEAPLLLAAEQAPKVATFDGIQFAAPAEIVQPMPRGFEPSPIQAAAAAPAPRVIAASIEKPAARTGGGYVVQLGAFSAPQRVETAWDRTAGRFGELGGYTASSTTIRINNATLYRLSLSGFETRREATALCVKIKAKGGACFVRSAAGDMPLQWVKRHGYQRLAAR